MPKKISTILQEVSEYPGGDIARAEYLRSIMTRPLAIVIQYAYDDRIQWELPEGDPPYKPSEFDEPGNFYQELKRLYLFTNDPKVPPKLREDTLKGNHKRERLFIDILEYVDKEDAKLLLAMKERSIPYNRLTKKFMQKALPELFENVEEKVS